MIYPQGTGPAAARRPAEPNGPGPGSAVLAAAFLLALGGAWLWVKRRHPAGWQPGRTAAKLAIAETRSLGNRQFLVVASYEDKKFLLGVCPGQVTLLTTLDSGGEETAP
ncbi:MAG: flagellar biosynthetic protein FliO [Opitutae bacterium]|nr:flagellar biosynthetic protein FliO [Opitutae bacterium]